MPLKKPQTPKSFEEVHRFQEDIYNNLGMDDLKPSNTRTDAPTTETMDKGRFTVVELSGVPYIYYLSLSGVLYRKLLDAV